MNSPQMQSIWLSLRDYGELGYDLQYTLRFAVDDGVGFAVFRSSEKCMPNENKNPVEYLQ